MNDVNFFPPKDVAAKMCETGVGKCRLPLLKMFLLAILAGVYIAFGAQLFLLVGSDSTLGFGFTRFLSASVFTVGLMMVVIGGAELFTGNNLVLIAALDKKVSWVELLKNWVVVYIGNFVGSILVAAFLFWGGTWSLNNTLVGSNALKVALSKTSLTFAQAFFRGILCNWLVCMAVWMAMASKDVIGKLFAIYFPIMAFVASGFEHSVANMFFIPYGIFLKGNPKVLEAAGKTIADVANLNWGTLFTVNLIPVTLGNLVGGAFFVGFIYWVVYLMNTKK
ncbi:formate/nitrite transporter family protein [Caldisericum sp. AR60]|uniref:formate/nitrite transporter family protein n=1 Tax=Caldisericum sp. AR60 TaxID=3397852 RepID=UPI0039FBF512